MKKDNKRSGRDRTEPGSKDPQGHNGHLGRSESATQGSDPRSERNAGDVEKDKGHSSADSSNREGNKPQDPLQQQNGNPPKAGRGYQDMSTRSQEQDYNKNLDEDNMEHYDSESGFEEFDEYADEDTSAEGMDAEYNSRYNDDRQEDNEKEELHTDTDVIMELEEADEKDARPETDPDLNEDNGSKDKKTAIEKQNTPYSQTESEGDHNDLSPDMTTNRSMTKDNATKGKEEDDNNRPGAKKGKR